QIKTLKISKSIQYEAFLQSSEYAVTLIMDGMKQGNREKFFLGIRQNREALALIGQHANVEIETEKLHNLSIEAEKYGGAGKLSGAGGGDCGIAFIPSNYSCVDL